MSALLLMVLAAGPVRWEVPHVVREVEVPSTTYAGGYPVEVRAVQTQDKPEDVVRFFLREWDRRGLFVADPRMVPEPLRYESITALDTRTLVSYTVILQVNPRDGLTTAIMTETALAKRRADSTATTFPGATDVVQSSSEGVEIVSYSAAASAAEVGRFYRDVLGKAGYAEAKPLVFERGGASVEVVVRAGEEKKVRVSVFARPPSGP